MKNTKFIIIVTLIIVVAGCKKSTSNNSYEGKEYTAVCEQFDELAFEQKDLLDQIRSKFKKNKLFIAKFNQEQISWIQYQDNRLRSLYPEDWDRFYRKNYGVNIFNGCKCKELIRLSKIRNDDLRVYLDGPNSTQQDCPTQGNL